ncbi:MAG: anti-sigma F factor [Firmicutes bacterium]|nr:anti-sigma F factor [Alicyclobacillaceae bacterium]MCL6496702.1 anti-sigma F factor [Bacillota bacterium]
MTNRMILRFLSLADNVGLARVAVAQMAGQIGFSLSDVEEIKVAVSEAVSNAIIHGYQGREDGWVEVACSVAGDELVVTVEDWGVGIADIAKAREPAYSTDPERMGLGFVFMESLMHAVVVESAPGRGTRVEMRRRARVGALSRDVQ